MTDEDDIRQLVETWAAATKAGDVETVLSLMSDDAVLLVPGQPPMGKADFEAAAKAHSGDNAPKFDGSSEIQEIKVVGDWAFMVTKMRLVVTPARGRKFTREGHTLSILKKENRGWVLARDANLLSPVPNV
jgi:uncharacterized protein (TIGR02246 family)